ncbi:hypothetical protein R008_G20301 [Saccharomyces cerevisiae R008]|nr:hypothetical protein R008_G20301 [Saccharomyces cerevisiae R008]
MLIFIIHYHRHLALHLMGAFQKHSNSISPPPKERLYLNCVKYSISF